MSRVLDLILGLTGNATTKDVTAANTPAINDSTKKLATTEFLFQQYTGAGKQVLSAPQGMQVFPGGLILKWGYINAVPSGGALNVTFTTPFPNNIFNVSCTIMNTGGNSTALSAGAGAQTASGFSAFHNGENSATAISWFAIGN